MISVSIRQEGRSILDCPKWRPFRDAHRHLASPGFPCTGLVATVRASASPIGFGWSSEGCGLSWEDVSERIPAPDVAEASA